MDIGHAGTKRKVEEQVVEIQEQVVEVEEGDEGEEGEEKEKDVVEDPYNITGTWMRVRITFAITSLSLEHPSEFGSQDKY